MLRLALLAMQRLTLHYYLLTSLSKSNYCTGPKSHRAVVHVLTLSRKAHVDYERPPKKTKASFIDPSSAALSAIEVSQSDHMTQTHHFKTLCTF